MTKENYERKKARRDMGEEVRVARIMREDREQYRITVLGVAAVVMADGKTLPEQAIVVAGELYDLATEAANARFPKPSVSSHSNMGSATDNETTQKTS